MHTLSPVAPSLQRNIHEITLDDYLNVKSIILNSILMWMYVELHHIYGIRYGKEYQLWGFI